MRFVSWKISNHFHFFKSLNIFFCIAKHSLGSILYFFLVYFTLFRLFSFTSCINIPYIKLIHKICFRFSISTILFIALYGNYQPHRIVALSTHMNNKQNIMKIFLLQSNRIQHASPISKAQLTQLFAQIFQKLWKQFTAIYFGFSCKYDILFGIFTFKEIQWVIDYALLWATAALARVLSGSLHFILCILLAMQCIRPVREKKRGCLLWNFHCGSNALHCNLGEFFILSFIYVLSIFVVVFCMNEWMNMYDVNFG